MAAEHMKGTEHMKGAERTKGAEHTKGMEHTKGADRRRIVVGVDGSPPSREALRWAIRQAALTGAVVDALITWEFTPVYGWSLPSLDPDLAAAAGHALAKAVEETAEPEPGVEIRERAACGNAAAVLLEYSRGADLLVLGNRGHGGFAGALLGSVTQHCVQHAACPVVVVPHGRG
jgi:nucleotide-binding universal stress UspA family protein